MQMKAAVLALLGVLLMATPAAAQGDPSNPSDFTNNPHPAMPWAGYANPNMGGFNYGQTIKYIPVPAQQVVIEVAVSVPDGVPAQTQTQIQEIPGYYVTETTTGYYYPERWTLQQANVGVYRWVKVPAEFRRK